MMLLESIQVRIPSGAGLGDRNVPSPFLAPFPRLDDFDWNMLFVKLVILVL